MHVGAYSGIGAAHAAIHAWRRSGGRRFAGTSWEVYGDWDEDESRLETTVYYLLQQDGQAWPSNSPNSTSG